MGISNHLKEIGRGKDGARHLTREQAHDLFAQILDGQVSDLELGAFCIAMRVKGETAEEMAGFLDATHTRITPVPQDLAPTVVLPSYNGARKLPVLTPLLAGLLARQGVRVIVHGHPHDPGRLTSWEVLQQLQAHPTAVGTPLTFRGHPGHLQGPGVHFIETSDINPALQRLLNVRRTIGLRNSAHSLVKLMQPCQGPALLVSSYTHPEYLHSMGAVFALTQTHALLLRGTEGEPVADPRRTPQIDWYRHGQAHILQAKQDGPLAPLPALPPGTDLPATCAYILQALNDPLHVPAPIATQVRHTLHAVQHLD